VAQFESFDIVVVPFPYTDRLGEKRRPAIIVSHPSLEEDQGVVWVAMITSSDLGTSDAIAISEIDVTGLNRPSFIRPAKLTTLETSRVLRKTGKLSHIDKTILCSRLKSLAGF
jgi:mRNA interferase MazF